MLKRVLRQTIGENTQRSRCLPILAALSLTLLAACAPQTTLPPIPDVTQIPMPLPTGIPQGKPVVQALPGTPMPLADEFSSYPTGAVLPAVAPDRYGLLRFNQGWEKISIVEAFTSEGKLDKAVRLEGGLGEGFLTAGAPDWTDYRVTLRVKTHEACCTESAIRARLFMNETGSKALEFRIGFYGVRLIKIAGDQSFTLIDRPELETLGRAVLRDQNWHDLSFELHSDGTVTVRVDDTEVVTWKDADYRQGGFGIGPINTTFFLDDLRIEPLASQPQPPEATAPQPGDFCGYRAGAELPHQRFEATGPVSLTLLGGYSAARDYRVGYYETARPEVSVALLEYAGAFDPAVCLTPPPTATFTPSGPFGLAHTYEHYGEKTIYTEDARNGGEPRFRAYEALNPEGRAVGVLLLLEDWVDNDYDDVGLLLEGARPVG
ncbi:hypothetical protein [Marinithermus hydrothermalis]|uniref:3-keto-disaccharide hydrolase domain-containing protein n=1 Tax=Marinithermus hydrothermalis (strain DSM 14884 / JCM 11576 / T1) TaxID=869210 RepID=F2NKI4_MARHT|nr:hypothetical protein [Marinithermus hydrothermalis]AEB12644.1 hypothetical protein Marky_1914 [Marinithermus hydrothermalis DSM 14884]